MTMPWREVVKCEPDAHCPCWYSKIGVCCVCGDYATCGTCNEPIVRAPGAEVWEHAVVLDENEDDYHVPEPAEEVFDEQGCALPRNDTTASRPLPTESRIYEEPLPFDDRETKSSVHHAKDVTPSSDIL
jgi:hypothetical protein